jgi:NADPH:quinone reductase-like Zn-dependent oxidoreductase
MRAVVTAETSSPPELVELEVPEPAEGHLRVRVAAASLNGFDLAVAAGYTAGFMEHRYPVVLGKDFAGTVDAVGPGVEGYSVGDRVFGVVTKPYLGDGSLAEFVTVPVAVGVAELPDEVDFTTGAALGLAGVAAHDAVDVLELKPGQTVLVAGATGGVGTQVVQLATGLGAHVIATAHTDEEKELVARLGATEVVDHTGDIAAQVRAIHPDGIDAVVHLAGDPAALLPLLRDGGSFVSTLLGSPDQLGVEHVRVVAVAAAPTPETLRRLAANQTSGRTAVTVQRTYPLADFSAAFADFTTGTLGKIVIVHS